MSKADKHAQRTLTNAKAVPRRLALSGTTPHGSKRCIAKARSGERCKSAPLHGKKKCGFHTGNTAAELGARGGRRRAIFNPDNLEPFTPPKNAEELLKLLATTICEIRSGRLEPRTANSVVYASAGFINALEIADLDTRLKALEKQRQD